MSSFSWIDQVLLLMMLMLISPGDTGKIRRYGCLTYNVSSLSIRETFEANYEGINRCNQALNIAN
jgi:hypothetical protein